MAYITDTELGADEIDPALLELARDASIVVIDTTYTDDELPEHVGLGTLELAAGGAAGQ